MTPTTAALAAVASRLLVDPVLATVFPSRCPACGEPQDHPSEGPLCARCWSTLPRHRSRRCDCGEPLPTAWSGPCGRCRRGLSPFAAGASLGPYESGLRTLIHELKYRGRRRAASRIAEALLTDKAVRRVITPGAVLVPVPLHPARERQRGFNQSLLLARELARRTGLVCLEALVRHRDTTPQTGLTAAARRRNVAGAFSVRLSSAVAEKAVVLVDDVITTGATVRACARALKDAGTREVRLLTVARVD